MADGEEKKLPKIELTSKRLLEDVVAVDLRLLVRTEIYQKVKSKKRNELVDPAQESPRILTHRSALKVDPMKMHQHLKSSLVKILNVKVRSLRVVRRRGSPDLHVNLAQMRRPRLEILLPDNIKHPMVVTEVATREETKEEVAKEALKTITSAEVTEVHVVGITIKSPDVEATELHEEVTTTKSPDTELTESHKEARTIKSPDAVDTEMLEVVMIIKSPDVVETEAIREVMITKSPDVVETELDGVIMKIRSRPSDTQGNLDVVVLMLKATLSLQDLQETMVPKTPITSHQEVLLSREVARIREAANEINI